MQAQCCPVCQGTGTKTVGFYTQASIRDGTPTKCRSCDGKGYVVVPNDSGRLPDTPQLRMHVDPSLTEWVTPPFFGPIESRRIEPTDAGPDHYAGIFTNDTTRAVEPGDGKGEE